MDDLRGSFSKLKKDIKHRLTGGKRKADKIGCEERADPSGSLPQPEPDVVTDGGRERVERSGSSAEDGIDEPVAAADSGNKSDWKITASASAKMLLRGVRDSADAFGPLKSVAGGLCFILENCEVRSPHP